MIFQFCSVKSFSADSFMNLLDVKECKRFGMFFFFSFIVVGVWDGGMHWWCATFFKIKYCQILVCVLSSKIFKI